MKMKNIFTALCILVFALSLSAQDKAYAPTLLAPASASTNIMITSRLNWEAIAGYPNLSYEVEISDVPNFSNVIHTIATDKPAIITPVLMFNKEYHWRVRAIDESNVSDWSPAWSYTTFDTVRTTSPGQNHTTPMSPAPSFSWNSGSSSLAFAGITMFELLLCDDASFDTTTAYFQRVFFTGNITGSVSLATSLTGLEFNTMYYWKMRAHSSIDIGNWTSTKTFSTVNKNVPSKPENLKTGVAPNEELSLTGTYSSCQYIFEIDTDENFSSPTQYFSTLNALKDYDTLLFNTKYFWRAKMQYEDLLSDWTDAWAFTVIGAPILREPIYDSTLYSTPASSNRLVISRIATVQEYIFQISKDQNFPADEALTHDFSVEQSGSTTVALTIDNILKAFPLVSGERYYWRVKAINSKNTSDWSLIRRFKYSYIIGIEDYQTVKSSIYPNPNNGSFNLEVNTSMENAIIKVYDLTGRTRYNETATLNEGRSHNINVNLPSGLYILEINNKGIRTNLKFTVK